MSKGFSLDIDKRPVNRDPHEGVETSLQTWCCCVWVLARHVKAGGWGQGSIFASM